MSRRTKSDQALVIACPHCDAAPGFACKDWRGNAIQYCHNRRIAIVTGIDDWAREPTLDNFSGPVDELIAKLSAIKEAGFKEVFFDSGAAPIYGRAR